VALRRKTPRALYGTGQNTPIEGGSLQDQPTSSIETDNSMLVLYFCLNDAPPVMRYWASAPRIGDMVALPEFGGSVTPLRVYDIVWEGSEEPSVSVYVHHATIDHPTCKQQHTVHRSSDEIWNGAS
jgi:hypothetical protein